MDIGPSIEKLIRRRLPFLYNPLLVLYRRLFDADSFKVRRYLRREISKLVPLSSHLTYLQVGANDGFSNDPLCDWVVENEVTAYLFEPVPSCFKRLIDNYTAKLGEEGVSRVHFINEAVTEDGANLTFYSVSDRALKDLGRKLPSWWDQLGSFDRLQITKHLDGVLEPYIIETQVRTVSLATFVQRAGLRQIDVLHIDAESHDFRVLNSLDFVVVKPRVILMEHKHLPADDRQNLELLLEREGFKVRWFQSDLVAVARPADPTRTQGQ